MGRDKTDADGFVMAGIRASTRGDDSDLIILPLLLLSRRTVQ